LSRDFRPYSKRRQTTGQVVRSAPKQIEQMLLHYPSSAIALRHRARLGALREFGLLYLYNSLLISYQWLAVNRQKWFGVVPTGSLLK